DATVTIDGGALTSPQTIVVPTRRVAVQTLPWQPQLKLCNPTIQDECIINASVQPAALVPKGAYHLRSTAPVTVYQFSPLQYTKNGQFSYTNDASLLLPANVWRTKYVTASYQHTSTTNPGMLAVTAMKDGTKVTILPKANTNAGQGAPAFTQGVAQDVML